MIEGRSQLTEAWIARMGHGAKEWRGWWDLPRGVCVNRLSTRRALTDTGRIDRPWRRLSMATFVQPHLVIPAEIYEAMISHCGENAARRSCGILAGIRGCAEVIYRIQNIATNPDRYESEPNDMISAYIDQRERGLAVVAIYHSCLGGAIHVQTGGMWQKTITAKHRG